MDSEIRILIRKTLLVALVFHLLAAVMSEGFHHADEQFQILEFSVDKLRGTSPDVWEYHAEMRPWLQPAVATFLVGGWRSLGVSDPLVWASSFRILSCLLSWCALYFLVQCLPGWIRNRRVLKWSIVCTSLIWFLPYLHARGSSENWSGALFLLGFAPLILAHQRDNKTHLFQLAFVCGLAWGAAFQCRYQIAAAVMGGALWLLVYAGFSFRVWGSLVIGGICATLVGIGVDAWGYERWGLTPWNYFQHNIVLDRASDFGVSPYYFYFLEVLIKSLPPISIAVLLGPLLCWFLLPRHPATWATLPFVLLHLLVPHKELRFLFPIAAFAMPMFFLVVDYAIKAAKSRDVTLSFGRALPIASAIAVLNILAMIGMSVVPARMDMDMYRSIYDLKLDKIYAWQESPYRWQNLQMSFYRPDFTSVEVVDDVARFPELSDVPFWITTKTYVLGNEALHKYCEVRARNLPEWLAAPVLMQYWWHQKLRVQTLFRCQLNEAAANNLDSSRPLLVSLETVFRNGVADE